MIQGVRIRVCGGGLMRKKLCLERLQNGVLLLMESMSSGNLRSGYWMVKMLRW